MITLGIDLASRPAGTAACAIEWTDGRARVVDVACDQDDEALLARIAGADKVGVDVPFGWPDRFVDELTRYHSGGAWLAEDREPLKFRATDFDVAERALKTPLSVSSQLIAVPAMRAARLFTRVRDLGIPIDRTGRGRLVEVYPGASLKVWGLPFTQYKGKDDTPLRDVILGRLRSLAPWLRLDEQARSTCLQSADALDALIAGLVARAAALGLCEGPSDTLEERASREGWIALPPADALDRLL